MKTAKLIIGIASIVLSVVIMLQSCAAGAANALGGTGEVGGTGGLILAMCMLIAGIVGLATRNSDRKGGCIASGVFYVVGALLGAMTAGSYSDLYIWAVLCFIFGAVFLVSAIFDIGF